MSHACIALCVYRPWIPLSGFRWRILAFVGILLTMGIVRQPVTEHFRKPRPGEIDTRVPAVTGWGLSHMNFEQIMRYIHFADNGKADAEDRAAKVRPLLDMFKQACLESWEPGKRQSIDEMMIRFKGRLGWRQYMKDKPIKFGLKIWGLCEPESGYLSTFDIYCGKKGNTVEKGLAENVVLMLVRSLLEVWPLWTGGHIYMDNFYTSLTLALALWAMKIACCGTLRANRKGIPSLGLTKRDERDSYSWQCLLNHSCRAVVGEWVDNSLTRFLSTIHGPGRVKHQRRRKQTDRIDPVLLSSLWASLLVVRRERTNSSSTYRHWVPCLWQARKQPLQILMHHRVMRDVISELF